VKAAAEEKVRIHACTASTEKSKRAPPGIYEETESREAVSKILKRNYEVVGGTGWVWSKEELSNAIDVLVVDERADVALANVASPAHSSHNLVLLGSPAARAAAESEAHPEVY